MKYQPRHLQQLFNKSPETIRQWSIDYGAYLSIDANPSTGHRRYTDDDLRVLSYVNYRKSEGATPEQILAELANGQRAEPPQEPSAIVAADERGEMTLLQVQLEQAHGMITHLRSQLDEVRSRADRAEGALRHSDELHAAEVARLERRLDDKEQLIRDLYRQLARFEAAQDDE